MRVGIIGSVPGIGLTANGPRVISTSNEYDKYFPLAGLKLTDPILANNGDDVFATLKQIIKIAQTSKEDTAKIAPLLKAGDLNSTLKKIWSFTYKHLQYKVDKAGVEELRRACRSWKDRAKGVDCEDMSIFISSILQNLGIPHSFRMTKYNNRSYFQHIYIVVPKDGKNVSNGYYTLDAVVDQYNYEVPYSDKYDMSMPIQFLNGLGSVEGTAAASTGGISYNAFAGTKIPFGQEFKGFGSFSGLGGLGATPQSVENEFLARLKKHLINTRDQIAKTPIMVENPVAFLNQLNYLIANFDNDQLRTAALEKLAAIEETQVSGLGSLGKVKFFKGVKEAVKAVGKNVSSAAKTVAKGTTVAAKAVAKGATVAAKATANAAVVAGKAILKYNPVSLAIRGGLSMTFKNNLFRMAENLGMGYLTDEEAQKLGIDPKKLKKNREKLEKVKDIWHGLQGEQKNLKDDIMDGWKHGRKKRNKKVLSGIGSIGDLGVEPVTTSAAVAAPVIATIKALIAGMEPEDVEMVVDAVKAFVPAKTTTATTATPGIVPTTTQQTSTPVVVTPSSNNFTPEGQPAPNTDNAAPKKSGSILPIVAIAGGVYLLSRKKKGSESGKKTGSLSGVKDTKKAKRKRKTIKAKI